MSKRTDDRRDVTVYHADGRNDTFSNVSSDRSRELENLPFTDPRVSRVDSTNARRR